MPEIIGQTYTAVVDRPSGSSHPEYPDLVYPINYGYLPGVMAGDGEEQDVYILNVDQPLRDFTGIVCAIIHRIDDCEDKWVMIPQGTKITMEEIQRQTAFQEKYFQTEIIMKKNRGM